MNATAAIETLGCKVNQYESSYILETLRNSGYRIVDFRKASDIYVVHSCAVTSKASYQTRQLLRRARRINPDARIVVAGCNVHTEAERLAEERLATHILGNEEKYDLVHWVQLPGTFEIPLRATSNLRYHSHCRPLPVSGREGSQARALLKVQDGCNAFCSYCIVPYTRGKSRSIPTQEVVNQMVRFEDHGYREIVLTGIHLGQWGRDLGNSCDLSFLLQQALKPSLSTRIRLSSLESAECTHSLLLAISSFGRICPHFHIPLQSGDADVLKKMHRPYTPGDYGTVIDELHNLFPQAALGADVMVGFPGESQKAFDNTVRLVSNLPLTYLHVFPFSPRPGTRAETLPGRVTGEELRKRAHLLHALSARKRYSFQQRFLGKTLEVIAESQISPDWWRGTSDNYIKVSFQSPTKLESGLLVRVRIIHSGKEGLVGKIVSIMP